MEQPLLSWSVLGLSPPPAEGGSNCLGPGSFPAPSPPPPTKHRIVFPSPSHDFHLSPECQVCLPSPSDSQLLFRREGSPPFRPEPPGEVHRDAPSCPCSQGLFVNLLMFYKFIYLFIFGCVRSSFLCEGFLQLQRAGATLHRGARASHRRGLSRCGAQAPDAQAQQLWLTGPVAPRHVGSSQTRARTRVRCIGRQTLNHCATREALLMF